MLFLSHWNEFQLVWPQAVLKALNWCWDEPCAGKWRASARAFGRRQDHLQWKGPDGLHSALSLCQEWFLHKLRPHQTGWYPTFVKTSDRFKDGLFSTTWSACRTQRIHSALRAPRSSSAWAAPLTGCLARTSLWNRLTHCVACSRLKSINYKIEMATGWSGFIKMSQKTCSSCDKWRNLVKGLMAWVPTTIYCGVEFAIWSSERFVWLITFNEKFFKRCWNLNI